jgi:hypothetical protein
MKRCFLRLCLCVFLFSLDASGVAAAEVSPFDTRNQSPLISIYGLPSVGEASVKAKGKGDLRLTLDLANNYSTDSNARESIVLDGESTRLTLSGRYGIGHDLELGAELPFLTIGGGFLDHPIEDFHSAFGFPNGGRERAPRNRLLFRYRKDGLTRLNSEQSGSGPGDLHLTGGWQFYQSGDKQRNLTLRSSLKLPTGDTDSLRGSGSTDLALWVTGNSGYLLPYGQFTLFGAAGALGMTRGRILPDQQRPLVGFGALGMGFSPAEWIVLKIQADAHTSFYRDSDLKQLNAPSAQLTLGGSLNFSPKTSLDIGVTEDIVVGTASDVVFHLSLRQTF